MAAIRPIDLPVNLNITLNLDVEQSNFDDVGDFHDQFDLPRTGEGSVPQLLSPEVQEFRVTRLYDELREFRDAWDAGDLAEAFDGLLDLVYIALGTAHMMGLPWQEGWNEVQRANMAKRRAQSADESKYGAAMDIIKPEGWQPPDIEGVLARHG